MTVFAAFMRDRAAEIVVLVAFPAGQAGMFSRQRKLCEAMIEIPGGVIGFEAAGIVALFAPAAGFQFLECAAMLICVAALAAAAES